MKAQHTQGRLQIPDDGSIGSIETESGKPIGQTFQTRPIRTAADHEERRANARRLVACWNAMDGVSTTEIEAAARSGSIPRAFVKVIGQRNELLEVVKGFHAWAGNQADAQSKGGHATFDLWMLREQRDLASAAIEKAERGAA